MQKLITIAIAPRLSLALVLIPALAIGMNAIQVSAQEGQPQVVVQKSTPTNTQNNSKSDASYNYTAQPGDSYTKMARKAVQTYGIMTKTNLSGAQIIYAETNMTQQANSLFLNEGQKVSISQSTVKSWVDSSKKLSAAQLSAWEYYVQFVDFNTSNIGQSS